MANIFGTETRKINQQVKRNFSNFPDGSVFKLTKDEWRDIRLQLNRKINRKNAGLLLNKEKFALDVRIDERGEYVYTKRLTSQNVISIKGGRTYPSYAFTAEGFGALPIFLRNFRTIEKAQE